MRYFTIRQGALVTRFGTGTYLGATVGIVEKGPLKGQTFTTWHEGEVVALPDEEVGKYLREYNQLLLEGSIAESDEAAWKAFHEKREEVVAAEANAVKAEAETSKSEKLAEPADDALEETVFDDSEVDAETVDGSKGSQE